MKIQVYYSVVLLSGAALAIEALQAKNKAAADARKQFMAKHKLDGDRGESSFVAYGTPNKTHGFALRTKDYTLSIEDHRKWLKSRPDMQGKWKIGDSYLMPNHKTPEGRAIRKELDNLPSGPDYRDLSAAFILPKAKPDSKGMNSSGFVGMYLDRSSGGISMRNCTLFYDKKGNPIVGIPGAALFDKSVRIVDGLRELKASKVAQILLENELDEEAE